MAGYNAMPGLSSMSPSGAGRGGRAGASSGDGDVAHTIGVPGDMEGFEHEQLKFGIDESLL